MKNLKRTVLFSGAVAVVLSLVVGISSSLNSCATLNALAGLSKLQFKLNNANQFALAGIDLSSKRSASDISVMDGVNLLNAFRTGKFPLTFTLNVAVKNPNQPTTTGGTAAIQLTKLPWTLLIDDHETISGNIGAPVTVPGGGTTETIPLQISVDLKQFFENQSYNDMINLALALSGQGAARMQLRAQPTISTGIGSFTYPTPLTIVSTEFR